MVGTRNVAAKMKLRHVIKTTQSKACLARRLAEIILSIKLEPVT